VLLLSQYYGQAVHSILQSLLAVNTPFHPERDVEPEGIRYPDIPITTLINEYPQFNLRFNAGKLYTTSNTDLEMSKAGARLRRMPPLYSGGGNKPRCLHYFGISKHYRLWFRHVFVADLIILDMQLGQTA